MKYSALLFLLHIICINGFSQTKRSTESYVIADTIPAKGFYAEVTLKANSRSKKYFPGISANEAKITLGYIKNQKIIEFGFFDKPTKEMAVGTAVYPYRFDYGNAWNYDWKEKEIYPLLILTAHDSASNSTIYSGYIFMPVEQKWKLIASRVYIENKEIRYIWPSKNMNKSYAADYSNRWLLRSNGSWKALDSQTTKPPSLWPMSNIDSVYQQKTEEDILIAKLPKDSVVYKEGIFYQSIKEGSGSLVKLTDTVVVHYKGWLFNNGSVFDETKEKPATFPLGRLIKGWQLGVPHCHVGGKIRLYIPSGSAYGIRTFATDIPPNSTLVFDVEVLEVKEKIEK